MQPRPHVRLDRFDPGHDALLPLLLLVHSRGVSRVAADLYFRRLRTRSAFSHFDVAVVHEVPEEFEALVEDGEKEADDARGNEAADG